MRTQYERQILALLLDKYERSGKAKGIDTGRRIIIREKDAPDFFHYSTAEEKKNVIHALESLNSENILTFSYIPGEENYLIDKIVLNEESLEKAYRIAGRKPRETFISSLLCDISSTASNISENNIRNFLLCEQMRIREKSSIDRRYFTEDAQRNKNLLKALSALAGNSTPLTKRVFSSRVFDDSKKFEKETEADVLKVLRAIYSKTYTDDELLAAYSITKYPEIIEFRGHVRIFFKNGNSIDFSPLTHGAYINSETVYEIEKIQINAKHVITIENKANYIDWIEKHKDKDEIVIWHGGFYSPAKGIFMKLISACEPAWFHFGDIDISGFRIFRRLRESIAINAIPYMMDRDTLISNIGKAQKADDSYLKELEKLLEDNAFSIFHETIKTMIEYRVRLLEQENLI